MSHNSNHKLIKWLWGGLSLFLLIIATSTIISARGSLKVSADYAVLTKTFCSKGQCEVRDQAQTEKQKGQRLLVILPFVGAVLCFTLYKFVKTKTY